MRRLRVLLADDYSQMLALLQLVLEPTYHVVGTVQDGQSLVAAAQALRPDIIITDVDMPILNGIDATRELRKTLPDCCVIFHSSHGESEIMAAAFAAGGSGYVIKDSARGLLSSIHTVIRQVRQKEESVVMDSRPESVAPREARVSVR
jgi:DNA-binding NarL/FixJ family response regulator